MKTVYRTRSMAGFAALLLTAVLSVDASAGPITPFSKSFGGFADNGELSISFTGDTGLDTSLLHPADLVSAFTASYDDDSALTAGGPIIWDLFGLGGMLYEEATTTLETLSAVTFAAPNPAANPLFLDFRTAFAAARGNLIDITDLFGNVLASVPLPQAGIPLPSTLVLFGLGLLAVRRRRR